MRRLLSAGWAATRWGLELAAWAIGLRTNPFEGWAKHKKRNREEKT